MPFDLKGDARFTGNRGNFRLSCIINFYKRTDLLRNILTCLCEQDLDNNDFEVVLVEDRGGTNEGIRFGDCNCSLGFDRSLGGANRHGGGPRG